MIIKTLKLNDNISKRQNHVETKVFVLLVDILLEIFLFVVNVRFLFLKSVNLFAYYFFGSFTTHYELDCVLFDC